MSLNATKHHAQPIKDHLVYRSTIHMQLDTGLAQRARSKRLPWGLPSNRCSRAAKLKLLRRSPTHNPCVTSTRPMQEPNRADQTEQGFGVMNSCMIQLKLVWTLITAIMHCGPSLSATLCGESRMHTFITSLPPAIA